MIRNLKCLLLVLTFCSAIVAQTAVDEKVAEQRASSLVSQMSLEEKLDYLGGINGFEIRAIPRLKIPALKMADGPMGVRNYGPSTAYPGGIALAASWDEELVRRVGKSMGRDARARGAHFLLAPGMNIYRAPMCGRNFEYFGEDPFLAGRTAVAEIEGIQSQGVVATAKHFLGNNQEWDRNRVSSHIDERTLREIYLPAFEASVRQAHVGAIMDSYNPVNGVHMTQNGYFNTDVLRKDWGFTGIVMSDWSATYDGVAAANGGLDLEMPDARFMSRETLLQGLHSGAISQSTVDDKVRHILTTAIRFGFLDRTQQDTSIPLNDPESAKVALEAARGGIVLLKNDRNILPLDPAQLKKIGVIGVNAAEPVTGAGGSSRVKPLKATSFYDEIRKSAKGVIVQFAPGVESFRESFKNTAFTTSIDGSMPGLKGEFFNNKDMQGEPALVRTDTHVAFEWNLGSYAPGQAVDEFSARWSGYYTPAHNGKFGFHVSGDDGFRLYVDDKLLIDQWQYQGEALASKFIDLEAGHHYKLRLEYFEGTGDASIGFGISDDASEKRLSEARELARSSDVVVLCLGFNAVTEGEGADRSFELPKAQQDLVREVIAQNKKVIVVLTAGGNVDMSSWLGSVPALLHTWYPGQEGSVALADILFGTVNPSAKLPVTFESRWEDNAAFGSYYDKNGSLKLEYKEGVFLGYRHFDRAGLTPQFPFGFGMSYTTFKYGKLKVRPAKNEPGIIDVSFSISNKGKRGGAEIAQVYVAQKHPGVPRPTKELKGFSKTWIEPGSTKIVNIRLDSRAFAYFDTNKKDWVAEPGEYEILVGASSRDIRAKRTFKLEPLRSASVTAGPVREHAIRALR